jgi:5-methylcytosine-specific restriction protein B
MNEITEHSRSQVCWFVGASFGGTDDQTARFLTEGIWEIDYPSEKDRAWVKSMNVGDRIAIKATYIRKKNLPFDNRGITVSVMAIKAVGIIVENLLDGERVRVDWKPAFEPIREWYFYTYRATIWRVIPEDWYTEGLIAFAFDDKPQDIDRFRNAPFWRERFGSENSAKQRFSWTKFYEAVADKLLEYRNNRADLIKGIQEISQRTEGLGYLADDQYVNGSSGFVRDICPFTAMGIFNRGIRDANRKIIAAELANILDVKEAVPDAFDGVPLMNNQKSWYFPYEKTRDTDHIDALWDVFAAGIKHADESTDATRQEFSQAFDNAMGRHGVGWNLTFGLYWARPWSFLSLENNSQAYISKKLGITIGLHGPKRRCSSHDYLSVMETLEPRFQEANYPVHSYPELSLEAWHYKAPSAEEASDGDDEQETDNIVQSTVQTASTIEPYSVENILQDGCFLEKVELDLLLDRLRYKKNLILQGPPGTGKTWLAKRLAFALMGEKDAGRLRVVQFHPNLSYDDFVRGWRPGRDGKLSIANGIFMETIEAALLNPSAKFVLVIEEINRGNPAQIFGELLTLLEDSKRTPREALELCYPDKDGQHCPVHIPENLYVIGTMNIADRSLALVDLALRRRFAFVTLEPKLGKAWRDWIIQKGNVDSRLVDDIEQRLVELNDRIAESLGSQFRIGHSYVTPTQALEVGATRHWFRQVVETEIGPLLEEYWFDAPKLAKEASERLLVDW